MLSSLRSLALAALSVSSVSALAASTSKYASFASGDFSFTISAQQDNGDLYIRITSPLSNKWTGVGIGDQMAGALMFAVYPTGTGGTTLSQRVAVGQVMPFYSPNVHFTMMGSNAVVNGNTLMVAEGVCKNCTSWAIPTGGTGTLDLTSTQQPFIYAFGQGATIDSSSKSATLYHHAQHGGFSLDMTTATVTSGKASLPGTGSSGGNSTGSGGGSGGSGVLPSHSTGVTGSSGTATDHAGTWTKWAHIVLTLFGLVILFPLSVILLRVAESVLLHRITNVIGVLVVIAGAGIGIWWSMQVKPEDHFRSPHQVIGLLLLSLVVVQLVLGNIHHILYKRTQRKTLFSPIHRILGVVLILLGIAQGFIGFNYAGNVNHSWPLAIIIVGWDGLLAVIYIVKARGRTTPTRTNSKGSADRSSLDESPTGDKSASPQV